MVSATMKDGVFKVCAGGVEMDFDYASLMREVEELSNTYPDMTWGEALSDVAHTVASKFKNAGYEQNAGEHIAAVVLACMLTYFRRFIKRVLSVVTGIIERGVRLLTRFIDWLFSFI